MKVFVAGATGAIGSEVVPELRKRGHDVVGLARSDENARTLRALGAQPARADLFDADSLARAMDGCDVVVRAATHISTRTRPRAAEWAQNDRIRRDGTRALLDAAKRVGARRYVQESIVWVARPPDGSRFDEDSPPHPARITQSALDAERIAGAATGIATATLRLGFLYGPRAAHTKQMAAMLRKRMMPVIQPESTPLAFLHVRDAGRAFADAVEGSATGVYHVVDDAPTPTGALFDAFAQALGAPRPMRVPRWIGALGAGPVVVQLLTTPMVTTSERFRSAFGWRPELPSATEGVRQVARELS